LVSQAVDGVLVVDKPGGITSFGVVREVRRALQVRKAGHTGTLDPMATGVLPLCLGDATKIAQFITEASKSYEATLTLGVTTDTLDAEGKVLRTREVPPLTPELLEAAVARFRGTYAQIPPMFSAVRVGGQRLHELARAGQEVERAPRQVTVHELLIRDLTRDSVRLAVRCSKGFFVRVLASDLGEALGCGAHLSALRRTSTGPFGLGVAIPLAEVLAAPERARERLVTLDQALADLPELVLGAAEAERVRHGGLVEVPPPVQGLLRAKGPGGELLAVAEAVRGRLVYRRVL
jgi:tRNA pseudouridine55 synthase